jgi:hypothetical protein
MASVQALHNAAHDGDTITLPAGIFSWRARLNITKGITIQGATTIAGAGTANPIINDGTIILDDTPTGGIIHVTNSPSQSFRLNGITFRAGSTTRSALGAAVSLSGTGNSATSMRVDHCHFDQLYSDDIWINGWLYGVSDHNVMHLRGKAFAFNILHATYGGSTQRTGNGSWADYPWYGTDKFWFIETNTIIRVNAQTVNAMADSSEGARWVARHNYLENNIPSGHGTEGGNYRGQRVNEFYDNVVNVTLNYAGLGQRGGTSMCHDNTFLGKEPTQGCKLANFRVTWIRNDPIWGISDGTSVWDRNDTEGNGTYVEGHPSFLFDSGTDTSSVNSQGVMHDSTKNWVPNQWVGYSIRNLNPNVDLAGCIISNTSNTITYFWGATVGDREMIFNTGDAYEIHRVVTVMDGCGMGKGDQVTGNPPINSTTGAPFWPHQATEPCYSWNNVYSPNGHVLGFMGSRVGVLPPRENIEYFNLGGGFPANTTPAQVRSRYVAALNGVDYTGTFVYPHPFVTAQPTLTPSAIPSATPCSRLQRRLDRLERRQQRLERRHRSNPRLGKRIRRLQLRLQRQHCA